MKAKEIPKNINVEKFLSRVRISGSCWEYVGAGGSYTGNYRRFHHDNSSFLAHRVSWTIFQNEPLVDDKVIDHQCRNKWCVNPDHLRQVDKRTNVLENSTSLQAINFKKTHCDRGHELSGKNLYIYVKNGMVRQRICRICSCMRAKKSYSKLKERVNDTTQEVQGI